MERLELLDELATLRDLTNCAYLASTVVPNAKPLGTLLDDVERRLQKVIDGFDDAHDARDISEPEVQR